jgi:hypothetical protein
MYIKSRNIIHFYLIVLAVLLLATSCTHESDMLSSFPEVCFESEVLPVFRNSCGIAGCHDRGGESGYILNTFDGIVNSVVPGNPDVSPSYLAIISKKGEGMMPPAQPLSQDYRTLIRLWIYQGAKNTNCATVTGGTVAPPDVYNTKACFSRDILPVLLSGCAITGCHDVASHREGYVYTTYDNTKGSVRAGNPTGSKLYQVITTTSGEGRMPPSPYARLSTAAIDSVFSWIKNGALNETCGEVCDTLSVVSFNTTLWPVIQNSCRGCHSGTSPSAGIRLESYSNVAVIAANGSLSGSIKGTAPYVKMPPSGSLTACRITQFKKWIANGYPNN